MLDWGSLCPDSLLVSSGVGQGTVEGPLLFITFFNDSDPPIEEVISLNFADDKKLASIIDCSEDALRLQNGIDLFMKWCKDNKLELNHEKCKVITFTRKIKPIVYDYMMNGVKIKRVEEVMDLGVLCDKEFRLTSHREYITNRAKATLKFVIRQSHYFGKQIIQILYQTLVRSLLEFAAPIWSPHYMVHKTQIESVQKQIVLFLLGDNNRNQTGLYALPPYIQRCDQIEFTTLARRRINATVLFMHAVILGKFNSPHLRSLIKINTAEPHLRALPSSNNPGFTGVRASRVPDLISVKYYVKNYTNFSPFNEACRLFNIASRFIDPSLNRNEFRAQLLHLPDYSFGCYATV